MQDDKKYWLDESSNVQKVLYALYIACAVLIALDFTYSKHTAFGFEGWFGFYGLYGFVACVLLVLSAKVLRVLISRPLSYYGEDDGEGEDDDR